MAKRKAPVDSELARRKELTFEQAEGLAELPTQLQIGVVSPQLRALLWQAIHSSLLECRYNGEVTEPWLNIAYEKHVFRDHGMADEFEYYHSSVVEDMKETYQRGGYDKVFGLTQWILRREDCPSNLAESVEWALEEARAPYKLIEGTTFLPISSPEEASAFEDAVAATSKGKFEGARTHLKQAAERLTEGDWPGSVRESIHAVEAAAKLIAPEAKNDALKGALAAVAKKHNIHEAMQRGFANLYGFTSDEKGIRHALLEKGDANVDAVDAQFMLGACASFVSYLLSRAREGK